MALMKISFSVLPFYSVGIILLVLYIHILNPIPVLRTALFWDMTQHRVTISYRRFGINYWSHFQGWPLKMGPIGCLRKISKKVPLLAA